MRYSALLIAAVVFFPLTASAQTQNCRQIESASDRLACYDRATPPIAPKKARTSGNSSASGSASTTSGSETPLADMLEIENKKLDGKIKNICRGC